LQVISRMASKHPKPVPRKPRADAQRNRARILKIAKDAFTRSGANISLDDVARQARIGAGTLYRHFPTRDSLLEAVYRTEVERLAACKIFIVGYNPRTKMEEDFWSFGMWQKVLTSKPG
jgi:AcrR family transcriptional regulator